LDAPVVGQVESLFHEHRLLAISIHVSRLLVVLPQDFLKLCVTPLVQVLNLLFFIACTADLRGVTYCLVILVQVLPGNNARVIVQLHPLGVIRIFFLGGSGTSFFLFKLPYFLKFALSFDRLQMQLLLDEVRRVGHW